jgi:hypothetical protein
MKNYTLYKLKPGKRQVWLDWCNKLMTIYKDESEDTLLEEDLVNEMCLIFGEDDESFVLYKHEPFPGKVKKPAVMERELNKKHFELFAECLVPMKPRVMGYDIRAKGM